MTSYANVSDATATATAAAATTTTTTTAAAPAATNANTTPTSPNDFDNAAMAIASATTTSTPTKIFDGNEHYAYNITATPTTDKPNCNCDLNCDSTCYLPPASAHAHAIHNAANVAGVHHYDDDEDEREKADTTPENSKKIDDIIEQQQQQQQQQREQHTQAYNATAAASSPTSSSSSFPVFDRVSHTTATATARATAKALAANTAVSDDDSTAVNQFCNEKEAFCKAGNSSNSNDNDDSSAASNTNNTSTATTAETEATTTAATTPAKSFAFTIDNFNEGESDPAATAAKYKSMMERFQSRHRRGASMSKLEAATGGSNGGNEVTTPTANATTRSTRAEAQSIAGGVTNSSGGGETVKVKMRARDRSTSRVRDAAKRHSWSPRSSTNELSTPPSNAADISNRSSTASSHRSSGGQAPKPPARKSSSSSSSKPTPLQLPKGSSNLMANRTQQFTPRSTTMQMALQKVDFLCPQPPLADFKQMNMMSGVGGEDDVSEAGTYTLDGDNYTEEQKDLMNIDKSRQRKLQQQQQQQLLQQQQQQQQHLQQQQGAPRPKKLNLNTHAINRSSNVLEVNYYHQESAEEKPQRLLSPPPPQSPARLKSSAAQQSSDFIMGSHQSAGAYLEKIKSRVLRNMTATPVRDVMECSNEQDAKQALKGSSTEEDDMGCFTSVTTSGVLAKQGALDPRPKLTRRSGLSTSQIDSSEFVSNETKLKNAAATDHQKSEYRLNVFTNQKAAAKTQSPTPMQLSDTAVLKTAQTKNDWIQEWARNARARSLANESNVKGRHIHKQPHSEELMTRSYTSASDAAECLTDDSIYSKQCAAAAKLNRTLAERFRLPGAGGGECEYASDPALASGGGGGSNTSPTLLLDGSFKPPKSPTKIPSPLHSLGRARSASRTRTPLQNILSPNCGDELEAHEYLQKTAAAISSLQQSLTRKNSLKSPPHMASGSPRAHSARSAIYSPEECSPQHSLESGGGGGGGSGGVYQRRSPMHRRHGSSSSAAAALQQQQHQQLMTSSFNEQQLQLLTSGQYLMRQMRMRKNSFDGGNMPCSPVRKLEKYATDLGSVHTPDPDMVDEQGLSPLRRSSSYSTKIAAHRAARPQYQNLYTPPALRHNANYSLANATSGHHHHQHQHQQQQQQLPLQRIKKSASSNNFDGNMYSDYDEHLQYYINDEDEMLEGDADEYYSSGEELELEHGYYPTRDANALAISGGAGSGISGGGGGGGSGGGGIGGGDGHAAGAPAPLSNTRLNKALLMRIERSKQKVSGKVSSAPVARSAANANAPGAGGGVVACPNTPELPRRVVKSAQQRGAGTAGSARQSMPRDTSLSRLARQVPNSLASAKRQLLQTAAAGVPSAPRSSSTQRTNTSVQPKYLDISKYKPAQGNNFLRKNDAKSTLMKPASGGGGSSGGAISDAMKRSPSSSSMGLTRTDPSRNSTRSVKSVIPSCMTASGTQLGSGGGGGGGGGGGRASSAVRRDASVSKQKEAEMAMWKRRSTYDPMKAAAEDRRRKEEAKRLAMAKSYGLAVDEVPCESNKSSSIDEQTDNDMEQQQQQQQQQTQSPRWSLGAQIYGEDENF